MAAEVYPLFTTNKVISIVGRLNLNDNNKLFAARQACMNLGEELAKADWKLAVYTSDPAFVETDVIKGYLSTAMAKEKSIICYYPQGMKMTFAQMHDSGNKYFDERLDYSNDWEISFYRSLTKVDGVLLIGGGPTTMTAGQIALSRGIAILTIAEYGGAANQLWKNLQSEKKLQDEIDFQVMAKWNENSAKECIDTLNKQYNLVLEKTKKGKIEFEELKSKAEKWDTYLEGEMNDKKNFYLALSFLIIFVAFLIVGLIGSPPGYLYPVITILGLCSAGGVGATIRMIGPNVPHSNRWIAPLLGVTVGLLFSLLYLLPQLVKSSELLIPSKDGITVPTRIQYVSSMVVSFFAGLGFDYSLEQLVKRAKQSQGGIEMQATEKVKKNLKTSNNT